MNQINIPPSTAREIANPVASGHRHTQAVNIAISLIGQGIAPAAVFAQIRSMYGDDVPDKELEDVVQWAAKKNPNRAVMRRRPCPMGRNRYPGSTQKTAEPLSIKALRDTIGTANITDADLWEASPTRPAEDWRSDARLLLGRLYEPSELVNVVSEFSLQNSAKGETKAVPRGYGTTMTAGGWLNTFESKGVPVSKAGAWIRLNPVDGHGISDANVTRFRYLLIESDDLPRDVQLGIAARVLPDVAAIVDSGGRSLHAWLHVDCKDASEYAKSTQIVFSRLENLGIDRANKNPSRLARLPGALREIGAGADGRQRLLYLCPQPEPKAIFPL